MQLHVHPGLKERSVLETLRSRASTDGADFDQQRVACYDLPPAQRERAFAGLFDDWFQRLGLHAALRSLFLRFPLISARIERAFLSPADRNAEFAAELFGEPGRYTLAMRVQPATLACDPSFRLAAEHELMHVEDMLDPAFAHDRSLAPVGTNPALANLVRERYAVLWALSIDVRIDAVTPLPSNWWSRRRTELARAFGLTDSASRTFDQCRESFRLSRPTHRSLIERAESADPLALESPRARIAHDGPRPGSNCPLCGFSTFDWVDFVGDSERARALRTARPDWSPELGLCRRCAEVHSLLDPTNAAFHG